MTRRWFFGLLLGALLAAAAPGPTWGVTLDREGTGPSKPVLVFVCNPQLMIVKAGGKPFFKIELKAQCGVMDAASPYQFTPVTNLTHYNVTVLGDYNYDLGKAEETVWGGGSTPLLSSVTQCGAGNPWVTGQTCQVTAATNNTGVPVSDSYPKSALWLSPAQRTALQKWENWESPEQMLSDWNPYTPTGPSPISIDKPDLATPVPENASSFELAFSAASPAPNWVVRLEWAKIEMPKDPSIEIGGSWKFGTPAAAPAAFSWSELPAQVHPVTGVFVPGLYVVRAKVQGFPDNTWTNWSYFWVGQPNPQLETFIRQAPLFDAAKIKHVLLLGTGQERRVEFSKVAEQLAARVRTPERAPGPAAEVGEQLDRLAERLTALERQGGQACADCPRLRRDLDALRLHVQSPRPGGQEPQALLRDAQRLGRDLDRVEVRLPRGPLTPATPGALPLPTPAPGAPAPGPAPGAGPQLGARTPALEPRAPARPDPAVEQLGRDLDRLAAKLAALGDTREAQDLLREVQALRRQLAGEVPADQLAPLLLRHTQLEQQTEGLETRLRQVQPRGRTPRVLPGTTPTPGPVPRVP